MRITSISILIFALILGSSLTLSAQKSVWKQEQYRTDQLYVKLRSEHLALNVSSLQGKFEIEQLEPLFKINDVELKKWYVITISEPEKNTLNDLQKLVSTFNEVELAEKVPLHYSFAIPNDISSIQWSLSKIKAQNAWDIEVGSPNITVAIVDDAVAVQHEDLKDKIWINTGEIAGNGIDDDNNGYVDDVNGFDVADLDNNPSPPATATNSNFSHGTHCAGIAAGATNNGLGMASIGYNCSIIPVKTKADATSGASLQATVAGVEYAILSKADVISMSFGSFTPSYAFNELINYGHQQGIVFVAAAGNSNTDVPAYPASYQYVISVGASDQSDAKANFSNYGEHIDVMAPGVNIYSTLAGTNNSYGKLSGTSMACPMVSGLVGLMLSRNPSIMPDDIEACLESTADNIDAVNSGYLGKLGAGRINAERAIDCIPGIIADFEPEHTHFCAGNTISFIDLSDTSVASWSWVFPGGVPSSSTLQNPDVTFNTEGTYLVRLTVSNNKDTSMVEKEIVVGPPTLLFSDTIITSSGFKVYSKVRIKGAPPFNFSYTDGTDTFYVNNVMDSVYYLNLMVDSTTIFEPLAILDQNCVGTVSGQIKIDIQVLSSSQCNYVTNQVRIANNESGFPSLLSMSDWFGYSSTEIGDLNKDGVLDVAVAAIGQDGQGINAGGVYILFLNADGTVKSHKFLSDSTSGWSVSGSSLRIGAGLDYLGDLDGDGNGDLLVGVSRYGSGGFSGAGSAWILFLNQDGSIKQERIIGPNTPNLTGGPWSIGSSLGESVCNLGDLDDDGVTDIALGGSNLFMIVYLNSDGSAKGFTSYKGDDPELISNEHDTLTQLGMTEMAGIGDLDGDGVEDLAISEWGYQNQGIVVIVYLNSDGTIKDHSVLHDDNWSIDLNLTLGSKFGSSIDVAPDMNKDGIQDLFISSFGASSGGKVYLFYMDRDGSVKDYVTYGQNQSNFQGILAGWAFGGSVHYLGDLSGDGTPEIVIGQQMHYDGSANSGAAWIVSLKTCNECTVNASFETTNNCAGDSTYFTNTSSYLSPPANYWYWDFGDGDTVSGIPNPSHKYETPGAYSVKMVVGKFSSETCADSVINLINIDSTFKINYPDMLQICPFSKTVLEPIHSSCGAAPIKYSWNTSQGLSDSTSRSPVISVGEETTFYVQIEDAFGTKLHDTIVVKMLQNCCQTVAAIEPISNPICAGENIEFVNKSFTFGSVQYNWSFGDPDIVPSNLENPAPVTYTESGSFQVFVNVVDSCGSGRDSLTVVVVQKPDVSLGEDIAVCSEDSVVIGKDQLALHSYQWYGNGIESGTNDSYATVRPDSIETYIYEATNEFGCVARDTIVVSSVEQVHIAHEICSYDSVALYSGFYRAEGMYIDTIFSDSNCQTILFQEIIHTRLFDSIQVVEDSIYCYRSSLEPVTYQWLNCDEGVIVTGENQSVYVPIDTARYAVVVSSNGCVDTSNCTRVLIEGIPDHIGWNSVNIVPNPNNGEFSIRFSKHVYGADVFIINALGQFVYKAKNINTTNDRINLDIDKGIYQLIISTKEGTLTEKFVVN